jgi:hypothetical protein
MNHQQRCHCDRWWRLNLAATIVLLVAVGVVAFNASGMWNALYLSNRATAGEATYLQQQIDRLARMHHQP